jgi:uncharacterized protein (TIGR02453 family)
MRFTGVPAETFDFLRGLGANNSKDWFEGRRDDYDRYYIDVAKDLVVACGERLAVVTPNIQAQPKVLGSIFRINRDTRFSPDKRPYKDHLDLWFWEGGRKAAVSGFFLRVTADAVMAGVGAHGFDKEQLPRFREAVAGSPGIVLAGIAGDLEGAGLTLGGEHYVRTPRGYSDDGPAARFLRYNRLHAFREFGVGKRTHSAKVLDDLMTVWTPAAALHRWLTENIQQSK